MIDTQIKQKQKLKEAADAREKKIKEVENKLKDQSRQLSKIEDDDNF